VVCRKRAWVPPSTPFIVPAPKPAFEPSPRFTLEYLLGQFQQCRTRPSRRVESLCRCCLIQGGAFLLCQPDAKHVLAGLAFTLFWSSSHAKIVATKMPEIKTADLLTWYFCGYNREGELTQVPRWRMDLRELKALEIAARAKVAFDGTCWLVPSQSGANYEEARGAESRADFVHKVGLALKECRESVYWLKVTHRAELVKPALLEGLLQEAGELIAILAKSRSTAQRGDKDAPDQPAPEEPPPEGE
jgi:hypothetical protein